jgi:hypothetical protein
MSATATDTIRIFCKAKEAADPYEADVSPDLTVSEVIVGLNEEHYLPSLAAGERWRAMHLRTNNDIPPNQKLNVAGVKDGDQIEFMRDSHGAGA